MADVLVDPAESQAHSATLVGPRAPALAGLFLSGAALASLLVCVLAFAARQTGLGVDAACVTLLASGMALSWVNGRSRRIRGAWRVLNCSRC